MGNTVLNISSLTKQFFSTSKKNSSTAAGLRDLSLNLPQGQITALIGGNGSGKTTLFNIISGLIKPETGKIIFKDKDISQRSATSISRLGIGRMFQDDHIWDNLSVLDNLMAGDDNLFGELPHEALLQYRKTKRFDGKRKDQALGLLNTFFAEDEKFWQVDPSQRLAAELSGGQKKIVGLLRLMMGQYDVVLIDEPTASLDVEKIPQIKNILQEFKSQGTSVFLISHDFDFIEQVADYCLFLENGNIQVEGTPNKVFNSAQVQQSLLSKLEYKNKEKRKNKKEHALLQINNLSIGYSTHSSILKECSFSVYPNESVGISGKNGSGKSSLIKAIVNTIPYFHSGEIFFNNENVTQLATHTLAAKGIGVFMQGGQVFTSLSIQENLQFAGQTLNRTQYNKRLKQLQEYIPLLQKEEKYRHKAASLSGGERHQLALAMVLMNSPRLILLDEPTAGVDLQGQTIIYKLIKEIRKKENISLLIIEHNADNLAANCDRICTVENKTIKLI